VNFLLGWRPQDFGDQQRNAACGNRRPGQVAPKQEAAAMRKGGIMMKLNAGTNCDSAPTAMKDHTS
jgi:hypothetical protein